MTRNNGLQKSAGSVGSPLDRDTQMYVKEVGDSVQLAVTCNIALKSCALNCDILGSLHQNVLFCDVKDFLTCWN